MIITFSASYHWLLNLRSLAGAEPETDPFIQHWHYNQSHIDAVERMNAVTYQRRSDESLLKCQCFLHSLAD